MLLLLCVDASELEADSPVEAAEPDPRESVDPEDAGPDEPLGRVTPELLAPDFPVQSLLVTSVFIEASCSQVASPPEPVRTGLIGSLNPSKSG